MKADKSPPWRTSLLLSGSLILTVVMALLLAAIDSLQTRSILPPVQLPIVNVAATALAAAKIVPLAGPTASPTPQPTTTPETESADSSSPPSEEAVSIISHCDAAPPDWANYIVQEEDTLATLSIQSGVSEYAIAQANCLEFNQLIPGLRIKLPAQPPTAVACGPPSWWTRYIVRPGDTLFRIALRRGTTLHSLMNANCLVSSNLVAGRSLYVPPGVIVPPVLPTSTPFPTATATATAIVVPPTSPPTAVVPTATPIVPTPPPPTEIPSPTIPAPTATSTAVPPTAIPTLPPPQQTATAVAPTPLPTNTPLPPTATNTPKPPSTATPLPTNTPEPTTIPPTLPPPQQTATAVAPPPTETPQVGTRNAFVRFPTWSHFGLCYNLPLISHNTKIDRCMATD